MRGSGGRWRRGPRCCGRAGSSVHARIIARGARAAHPGRIVRGGCGRCVGSSAAQSRPGHRDACHPPQRLSSRAQREICPSVPTGRSLAALEMTGISRDAAVA
ncbi:hypothetical protein FQY83_12210 [Luteimonas marina]|uniref:Uncharacterized protein n=1 Tax=Luteimonas marina TaxID=488485 RepID=A0A5C5U0P9_9GAMM|nr:hypothetical protein FQY83_12210 [Luteimonas marina]